MKLSTLKSLYVCYFVVFSYLFIVSAISQPKNRLLKVPAVITFGDSILDTGNNNYIETIVKSNFKPYGRDFIDGKATGRFSNGRIPSDLFAEGLRVKEALPPYLDPNLKIEDLLTGVCFASAGAGFDPVTNELASVLSIEDQLNMFKEYKGKLIAAVGEEKTSLILADSVIIISMGSNDISGTYFLSPYRRIMYNIEDYTTMLVNASSNFLQELYNLGARRIGVLSLGPVGCVPMQRTISGGKDRKCVESVNQASRVYNSKISSSIVALSQSLPDARLVYLEIYDEFNHVMEHLSQFGFEEGSKQCCGIANLEVGPFCNSFALKICEDASKYVFWDSYHPTEKFYSILVTMLIEKNVNKFV